MMRIFSILIFILITLSAEDRLLFDTQIRMIPKIMVLDNQITTHTSSNKVTLGVVYDRNRKTVAQYVCNTINRLYNGQISSIRFTCAAVSVDELSSRKDISFIYLIDVDASSVKDVAGWSHANAIPTFSYSYDALESGILGTIAIERNTVLYINKNVMKSGKFRFSDNLYQIARFIE